MDNNPFNSLNKKQEKNNENNQIDKTSINTYFNQYPLNKSKQNLNNLIYYPIVQNISPTGKKQIIYLSSKNNPLKKFMLPQRSIELQINNKIDFKKFNKKLLLKNKKSKFSKNTEQNSLDKKMSKKNNKKISPESFLNKSNSVGCDSEILNNLYSSHSSPLLFDIDINSKIFNGIFIPSIKSVKRREELENSLEKLKRIKSSIGRGYSLNSSSQRSLEEISDENDKNVEGSEKTENEESSKKTKKYAKIKKINNLKRKKNFDVFYNSKIKFKNRIINNYEKNVKKLNNKNPEKVTSNINNTFDTYSQKIIVSKPYKKKKKYINDKKNTPIKKQIQLNKNKIITPLSSKPILVRKVLREEHYYIDSQGKEKIVEVIQSPITTEKSIKKVTKKNLYNTKNEINRNDAKKLSNIKNYELIKLKKNTENNKSMVTSPTNKNNPKKFLKLNNSIKIINPINSNIRKNMNNNNPPMQIPIRIKKEIFIPSSNSNLNNKLIVHMKSFSDLDHIYSPSKVKRRNRGNVNKENYSFHEIKNLSQTISNKNLYNTNLDNNSNKISSFSIICHEINPSLMKKNPIMFSAKNILGRKKIINDENMIFENKINNINNKKKNNYGIVSQYNSVINDNMKINLCDVQNKTLIKNDSINNISFQKNKNNNMKINKSNFYAKNSDNYFDITTSNFDSKKINDNKLKNINSDNKIIQGNNKTIRRIYNLKKVGIPDIMKLNYVNKNSKY